MRLAFPRYGTYRHGHPQWAVEQYGSPGGGEVEVLGLSSGRVSPSGGNIDTDFTYRVNWIDTLNGLLPTTIVVHINAGTFDMVLESGNATDGAVYAYTTKLTRLPHQYYFETTGPNFRYPDVDNIDGPNVDNRAPILSGQSVTPSTGNIDDDYVYEITYTDEDGDAASVIRNVIVDEVSHQMAVHSGSDPKLGIVFRHTESGLDRDPHKYRFEFSDAIDTVYDPVAGDYNGPSVENRIPTLSVGSVLPTSGNASTNFVYEVTYEDPDGDAPSNVSVWINNVQYAMSYVSGDYITGALYRYTTTLTEGQTYEFYFTCNDGEGGTDRLPAGVYDGPVCENTAPVLTLGGVTPGSGNGETTFTYEIVYTDIDGDSPTYVRVNIDGTDYDMSLFSGSDPVVGLVYRYETLLTPDVPHEYHFNCSDGTSVVRLPVSSEIQGPDVATDAAPELTNGGVAPASGVASTTFTYEVTYTDVDGDAPVSISVWVNGSEQTMSYISGSHETGSLYRYTTTLAKGSSHEYYFTTSNAGGSDRLPETDAYSGPTVNDSLPVLSDGSVAPTSGDTDTTFTYEVTYTDIDGDAATGVSVWIDDTEYPMSLISGSPTTGVLYRYTTTLAEGNSHEYYFTASNTGGSDRLPSTLAYSGPDVAAAGFGGIVNGTFDSNVDGWEPLSGAVTNYRWVNDGQPAGGMEIASVSSGLYGTVCNIDPLNFEAGKTYRMDVDFRRSSTNTTCRMHVNSSKSLAGARQILSGDCEYNWASYNGNFVAQAGDAYIIFENRIFGTDYIKIDNVVATEQ